MICFTVTEMVHFSLPKGHFAFAQSRRNAMVFGRRTILVRSGTVAGNKGEAAEIALQVPLQEPVGCGSSVAEHLIGNEEAEGSIPSRSTIYPPDVVARFWSKVRVERSLTCWPWLGSRDRHGYGQFKPQSGAPKRAHRIAWEIMKGEALPAGAHVLHRCDNPECCNPGHMFLGDHAANMGNRQAKGRTLKGWARGTTLDSIAAGAARKASRQ